MTSNTPVTQALLACPRCGNHAFVAPSTAGYPVWCATDACLKLPARATEDEAIAAWNQRHRQSSSNAGGVAEMALKRADQLEASAKAHPFNSSMPLYAAGVLREIASLSTPTAEPMGDALTPSPCPGDVGKVGTLADIVVQLSAIRTVLREAHFALDDSEDLSHLAEPVHAVPFDNVARLHRALKVCERFAPKDEAWEGPGPLVTQIIEQLGHHLAALTPSAPDPKRPEIGTGLPPLSATPSPLSGDAELERDLKLARLGDYPGAAGVKRMAAAIDALSGDAGGKDG